MRRRLLILAEQHPGLLRSLARSGPSRKYFVDAVVLDRALGSAHSSDDNDPNLAARIEDLEGKLLALRNAHVALRKRVRELESQIEAGPAPATPTTVKPAA